VKSANGIHLPSSPLIIGSDLFVYLVLYRPIKIQNFTLQSNFDFLNLHWSLSWKPINKHFVGFINVWGYQRGNRKL
jgi:hypothetical protein